MFGEDSLLQQALRSPHLSLHMSSKTELLAVYAGGAGGAECDPRQAVLLLQTLKKF